VRRSLGALSLTALLWASAAPAVYAAGPGDAESDAADGTSALRQLADATGHRSDLLRDRFDLPSAPGVLFILEPENAISLADAQAVARWVSGGGVLVYASEGVNVELETALGISRAGSDSIFEGQAYAATPLLAGLASVRIDSALAFAAPTGPQAMFLRSSITDAVVGIEGPLGSGHYFALATASPFQNGNLGSDDNGRLGADLVAAAGTSALVTFDQYHHAGGAGESSSLAWIATPWGFAIFLEILLVFGLLALSGRAFGPRIPLRPRADPSSSEFTSAVGRMLRRAGARRETVGRLLYATRAALSERVGIRGGSDPERLAAILRRRSPGLADALDHASASASAVNDERSLAQVAAELHRLAHPALGDPGVQPPNPATTPTGRRR
jgi:hypothetical protein